MSAVEGGLFEGPESVYPESEFPESEHLELSATAKQPPKTALDVKPLSLEIASALEAFSPLVAEVPSEAVDDMTYAVAEISTLIFQLGGAPLEAARHSVSQNLSKAVRVLRAGVIAETDDNATVLDNIVAAARELLAGPAIARQQALEAAQAAL